MGCEAEEFGALIEFGSGVCRQPMLKLRPRIIGVDIAGDECAVQDRIVGPRTRQRRPAVGREQQSGVTTGRDPAGVRLSPRESENGVRTGNTGRELALTKPGGGIPMKR